MHYHHITKEERVKMEAWLVDTISYGEIARRLGKDRSSIGREIQRNKRLCYPFVLPYKAVLAEKRRRHVRKEANEKLRKIEHDNKLRKKIEMRIKRYWSPEQIVGRLKKENHNRSVISHETIYQYLYRNRSDFKKYLRCQKGKYRRKRGTKIREESREKEKKRSIEGRPKIVEKRKRLGDWEGDTVVGKEKNVRIVTHVERKSGYLMTNKVCSVSKTHIATNTIQIFRNIPKKKKHTITYDNGIEFSGYDILEHKMKIHVYFAHSYHSWERGTNENTNGLLRQFFPKKTFFAPITQRQLQKATRLINTRPRKRLDYRTPEEVFKKG